MAQLWRRFGMWLFGLLWAVVGGAAPALMAGVDSYLRYNEFVDWPMIWKVSLTGALTGGAGYWRSHQNYLKGLLTEVPTTDN